jgi:hypothetical protein
MNSLRHVFWRGAMALSLMAVGIGSGFGFRDAPRQAGAEHDACTDAALHAARTATGAFPADVDHARDVARRLQANRSVRRG